MCQVSARSEPKRGAAPVSLVDIMKHTHGCTLTSETGATSPPLAIIKLRANPRARANATLHVICTVYNLYNVVLYMQLSDNIRLEPITLKNFQIYLPELPKNFSHNSLSLTYYFHNCAQFSFCR